MLACRSFTQNAAQILKSPVSTSEAVRYVTDYAKGVDYTNPLACVLEGPPLDQRLEVKNNQIAVSSIKKATSDSQEAKSEPINSPDVKQLREEYNKFYEMALPQVTSLFSDRHTSKRVKDTMNNFHRYVVEEEGKAKNAEGEHVKRLNSKNDSPSKGIV